MTPGRVIKTSKDDLKNLHVAGLVGAAICSASECGSHDRWPQCSSKRPVNPPHLWALNFPQF